MAQYPASSFSQKLAVTKSNTAGEGSLGTATVTGAAAATASSWGQVSASLSGDTLITQVTVTRNITFAVNEEVYVEIAYGGSGSETVVGAIPLIGGSAAVSSGASTPEFMLGSARIPSRVASGQRLAARITSSQGAMNTATVVIRLWGVPYANLEGN